MGTLIHLLDTLSFLRMEGIPFHRGRRNAATRDVTRSQRESHLTTAEGNRPGRSEPDPRSIRRRQTFLPVPDARDWRSFFLPTARPDPALTSKWWMRDRSAVQKRTWRKEALTPTVRCALIPRSLGRLLRETPRSSPDAMERQCN